MPAAVLASQHPAITIDGQTCPQAIMNKLISIEVVTTYNRPGMCIFTFDADANTDIPATIELGKKFDVAFAPEDSPAPVKIFQGEITALEFDFLDERSIFVVQAEDKFHQFFRGDKVATFLKQKVSDAAKQLAGAYGVPSKIDTTAGVLPLQMQANMSDGAWLLERAGELGFHVGVLDGTFYFGKVGGGGDSGVELRLGDKLQSFNARVTANAYAKDVTVRGWDPAQKKAIIGQAASYAGTTDSKVAGAFNTKPSIKLSRTDLGSVDEAKASAQAALDRATEANRQAEGRCYGDAKLAVDKEVKITGVNSRFNGKYRISHLRHTFNQDEGFMTEFSCRGLSDQSLAGLVTETAAGTGAAPDRSVFDGVTVGIVTDNNDKEGLGRVKVKLPALSEEVETEWIRMAFPGGGGHGGHHGWYLLPEVNDEVLVAFEQGDVRRAYVIGGLLNGKEKPSTKYPNNKVLESGKVNQHVFVTNSGSHLLFDEKDDVVEIANKDASFFLRYNCKDGFVIQNKSGADKFTVTNEGEIKITSSSQKITIEAPKGAIDISALNDITIESKSGKVAIKAATDASMEGMNAKVEGKTNAEVKGNVMAKLEGGANATVKGAMVMIN